MIETGRLLLRPWREGDRDAYAAMCRSPAVMQHLGGPSDAAEIDAALARNDACLSANGFCFWAIERHTDAAFLGFCGLRLVDDPRRPVHGEIEIGWRLREDAWGQGYAKESALACLIWAWATLAVPRIIAFTVPANTASWGLMRHIGMTHRPELDFDHPAFVPGHPLSRHVTYTIERP